MLLLALFGWLLTAQPQTATIAGRITDRATGQPISRMVVAALGSDRKQAGEALTDADGRYEISGLRPGAYAVSVSHDEHRSTYLRQWFGEDAPSNFGVPRRFAITLAAGDRRTDIDVALTRTLAIEGVIRDPFGDPAEKAEVSAVSAAGGNVGREAYTDDRGAYRLYGLAPGRYRVCARASNGWMSGGDATGLSRACYPAAVTDAEASDVTLASQNATGIDIRLQRAGIRTITGTVVDASGAPAERAAVSVLPADAPAGGGSAETRNGAFTVKGLTPGRYVVWASLGGSHPGDVDPPAREHEGAQAPVDLLAGDATIALALTKAGTLAGTVAFDGNPPPKNFRARLTVGTVDGDDSRPWFLSEPTSAAVRDDFSFELGDLFRLPVYVSLRGLPEGWALKSVRYGDRDITYAATDLTADPGARLQLVLTDKVASPRVKVVDERGEDVPAANVIAIPAAPDRWRQRFARIPTAPWTAGVGKLGTMLPGDYFFAALPLEDFGLVLRNPSRLASIAAIGTRVTLEAGDARLLTLRLVALPDK